MAHKPGSSPSSKVPKGYNGRKGPKPPIAHGGNPDSCCPMVAAVHALERGKFRLAARYARMSVRLMVAR